MSTTFEYLISPLERREFFLHYWGKKYYVSKGQIDRYSHLFSWEVLSEILSTHRFAFPQLRLIQAGKVIPPEEYIGYKSDRRGNAYALHDSKAILTRMNAGAVLHITSIGETWRPLATFTAQIEPEIDARVQVNLHAGFATSKGFNTHWDGHDTFAIQIAGKKKWRMFGVTVESPLAVPPDKKQDAPAEYVWEGVLETGDMIYIPRGYWHSAQALDESSLHLTFATQHPTGGDFINWLLNHIVHESVARKDIPSAIFDMRSIGETAKEDYLSRIRTLLLNTVSVESLERFLADYRGTLGRVNHIDLVSRGKISHADHSS